MDLQGELDSKNLLPDYELKIFTRIKRGGQSFRGHPNYRGLGPWRDWVWVDFGRKEGTVPCQIWCFVVIPDLQGKKIDYGGIRLTEGVFAVVESATLVDERMAGHTEMTIIHPIEKIVGKDKDGNILLNEDGTVKERVFYLALTDAFVSPCCAVPDIGGPLNRYWVIEPRNLWCDYFKDWLYDKIDDDMVMDEDLEQDAQQEEGEDEIDHDADTDPDTEEEERAQ